MNKKYIEIDEYIFYPISIYYSKNEWGILLHDIYEYYISKSLVFDKIHLYLSLEAGEHICVVFITKNENIPIEICNDIEVNIRRIIAEKPSKTIDNFEYGNRMWLNYPNNSINWNNFSFKTVLADINLFSSYSHYSTLLIISYFESERDITDEDIISLGFYFTISILKILKSNNKNHISLNIFDELLYECDFSQYSSYIAKVNINESTIFDVLDSYYEEPLDISSNTFLGWNNEILKISETTGIINAFKSLNMSLYYQLGLNSTQLSLLISLTKKWILAREISI